MAHNIALYADLAPLLDSRLHVNLDAIPGFFFIGSDIVSSSCIEPNDDPHIKLARCTVFLKDRLQADNLTYSHGTVSVERFLCEKCYCITFRGNINGHRFYIYITGASRVQRNSSTGATSTPKRNFSSWP